jgi:hypothetical protein
MVQHESIKMEYGELSDSLSVKDSIIQANAAEIKQLLNYKWEYRKVNKKLTLLRKITQGYVVQLDSLYTVNRDLKEENEKIRQQYSQEQERTRILAKDKEVLIEKVSEASVLKAYNVTATGIRYTGSGREKITDKAKKVEKIKVCFTIGENKLVKSGIHTIIMQIIRPDNITVTQKVDGPYTFEFNGQLVEYTSKKEIQYQNEDTDLCLFWAKKSKKLIPNSKINIIHSFNFSESFGKIPYFKNIRHPDYSPCWQLLYNPRTLLGRFYCFPDLQPFIVIIRYYLYMCFFQSLP